MNGIDFEEGRRFGIRRGRRRRWRNVDRWRPNIVHQTIGINEAAYEEEQGGDGQAAFPHMLSRREGRGVPGGAGQSARPAEITVLHNGQVSRPVSGEDASKIRWHSGQVRFASTMLVSSYLHSRLRFAEADDRET